MDFSSLNSIAAGPTRSEDCLAAPICGAIGNLRKGCTAGGSGNMPSEVCMAGMIKLIARIPGVFPDGIPTADSDEPTQEETKADFVKLADELNDGTSEEEIQLDYNR